MASLRIKSFRQPRILVFIAAGLMTVARGSNAYPVWKPARTLELTAAAAMINPVSAAA